MSGLNEWQSKLPCMTGRTYYKPLQYPWALENYLTHRRMHWLPEEITLQDDINDWKTKMTEDERELCTQILRFFTQGDIDVARGYNSIFLPLFHRTPELGMMMDDIASREAIHIHAYALLVDTIGMPETTYKAFLEYKEMKDKHDYVENFSADTPEQLAQSIAVYSGFTEGMQLFSSFIMLLNFKRHNKMKNMSQIVEWSIKDEQMHVDGMLMLFRTLLKEYDAAGIDIDLDALEKSVAQIARTMVQLEDKFIDLAFDAAHDNVPDLTRAEVKDYVRYITNSRLIQMGFSPIFSVTRNPLPWANWIIEGIKHTNFFEQRSTDYARGAVIKDMTDDDY